MMAKALGHCRCYGLSHSPQGGQMKFEKGNHYSKGRPKGSRNRMSIRVLEEVLGHALSTIEGRDISFSQKTPRVTVPRQCTRGVETTALLHLAALALGGTKLDAFPARGGWGGRKEILRSPPHLPRATTPYGAVHSAIVALHCSQNVPASARSNWLTAFRPPCSARPWFFPGNVAGARTATWSTPSSRTDRETIDRFWDARMTRT